MAERCNGPAICNCMALCYAFMDTLLSDIFVVRGEREIVRGEECGVGKGKRSRQANK